MSLVNRIQRFLHSPKGRAMSGKAQRYLQKPETQHKLRRLVAKLRGRH
ncbi:hypothetical protein [Phytomonospora endophytica]|uniref:Uncharacterized protein n=1 Tax=Phytomonospora endophytica TaxID=714109 RepID=A0A841G2G3_9ACTN|nr:hypothetical protein [Phytomonospora endophytica]MBB6038889.1 hypothetical protein [Phytomonospora endophytica]GIG68316.1 hypothetical protein Pen01_46110 [Phytomonospora endophytica]